MWVTFCSKLVTWKNAFLLKRNTFLRPFGIRPVEFVWLMACLSSFKWPDLFYVFNVNFNTKVRCWCQRHNLHFKTATCSDSKPS